MATSVSNHLEHPSPFASQLPEIPNHFRTKAFTTDTERVIELIGKDDGLGFSFAIADINETQAHFHSERVESYMIISGCLEVTVQGKTTRLNPGESIRIPPNAIHVGNKVGNEPVRLIVPCTPAWIFEDFLLASDYSPGNEKPEIKGGDPKAPVNREIYREKNTYIQKDIYEVVGIKEGLGFSSAIVDIKERFTSNPISKTRTMNVIGGELGVILKNTDNTTHILKPGDFLDLPKGTAYEVIPDEGPCRVFMSCYPGCSPEEL